MIVYIIPFLLAIFGSIKYDIFRGSKSGRQFLFIFLYIYLTLLIGFRYMVGGDTYFYTIYFNYLNFDRFLDFSNEDGYQPLFVHSMLLAKYIYPKFVSYQFLHVILINTTLFWFIKKESTYIFTTIFFCLLIFYINYTVEILRESLAIMVFILTYKYFEKKKWLLYFLGVFIATQFHLSAYYLFVLPFFRFLRLNYFYLIIVLLFTIVLTQLQPFLKVIESIQAVQDKIDFYSKTSSSLNTTLLFLTAKFIIPIGFFTYVKTMLKKQVQYEYLICILGLFGIGTIFNTLIFMRLSNYLLIFYCISISEIIVPYLRSSRANINQFVMLIMIFSSIVIIGYSSFLWPTGYYIKWIPYMSVFSLEGERGDLIYRE